MKNLVLIGMPGCGKTSIGKMVAAELQREHYDADSCLEEWEGCTIKELFAVSEECFREAEARTIERLALLEEVVISTGGGVIKRAANLAALRTNAVVVFIDRDPELIMQDVIIEERPLLAEGKQRIRQLYAERYELYKENSDYIIDNKATMAEVAEKLVKLLLGGSL